MSDVGLYAAEELGGDNNDAVNGNGGDVESLMPMAQPFQAVDAAEFDPFPMIATGPDGLRQRRAQGIPVATQPRSYLTRNRVPSLQASMAATPPPPLISPRPWPWYRAMTWLRQTWKAKVTDRRQRAIRWAQKAWHEWLTEETSLPGRLSAALKRNQKCATGAAVGCCGSSAMFLVVLMMSAGTSPVTVAELRTGAPGAIPWAIGGNFSAPSTDFTCAELHETSLQMSRLLSASELALHAGHACACAPMFGLRKRHLAIRLAGNATELPVTKHMFNVGLLANPPPSPDRMYNRVEEHQRMLFPNAAAGFVTNVRVDSVWLTYLVAPAATSRPGAADPTTCKNGAIFLTDGDAYCAQACLDLYDGVTVYQRAALAQTRTP